MTKVLINGSKGRMGQALIKCINDIEDLELTGTVDIGDDLESLMKASDVVIDFSLHDATKEVAQACVANKKPLVIGTTGHTPEVRREIESMSRSIPMVWATNFSTGVNTLFWLTKKAVEILGPDFNLEVVEMHHKHKQDAPSGTASTLVEILAAAREVELEKSLKHGREGITGPRTKEEIGVHSLRGGDVVGDHTVIFAGAGERLELTHKAASRDTFANGALRAAKWAVTQSPGLYNMQNVLGLE